jgi:alpha-glucosidase
LLCAALPGSLYIYQGEELGLEEVQNLPPHRRQDPMYFRSGGTDPGRDGCRVPLPWAGTRSPFGFSAGSATAEPWLPQPSCWAALTVEAEQQDPDSMLSLYRSMLSIRRSEPDLGDGHLQWLDSSDDVLAFARGSGFISITNFSRAPIELPANCSLLLASAEASDGFLPSDASAWLRPERLPTTHDRTLRGPIEGGE